MLNELNTSRKDEPEPLWLPDLCEGVNEAEFELSGLDSFQNSLASLLAKTLPILEEPASGLAMPPGLGAPTGLGAPPGLEHIIPKPEVLEQFTVAELYAQMSMVSTTESHEGDESEEPEQEAVRPSCAPAAPVLSSNCTTVMLRNIPNKYNRDMLSDLLRTYGYGMDVDFVYMPIDFRNKCNVGYAFLNFRTASACKRFAAEFHMQNSAEKLPGFKSKKVCEVSEARCQGRQENVRRLQASQVMVQLLEKPEWLPLLFSADGSVEEFPMPRRPSGVSVQKQQRAPGRGAADGARRGTV